MAQFDPPTVPIVTQERHTETLLYPDERRLRRTSAWLLLFFLLQGELGVVWDREWHAYVGRDQFWTPPHELMYSAIAGAGLVSLAVVLWETVRYYRRTPGVNDNSTVAIFRFFHAPLGFSVIGFGALCALCAAPLDNYWHELYGIDVALWAPFHMMGAIGGLIGMLGMVYVFASEAAIQRHNHENTHKLLGLSGLEIGVMMTLTSIMSYVITGFLLFPLIKVGSLNISAYPLPLIAGGAFSLIAIMRATHRPGTATALTLVVCLHSTLIEIFVPWAIRVAVAQQGITYRDPVQRPYFSLAYALFPLIFLIPALIIDILAWYTKRQRGSTDFSSKVQFLLGTVFGLGILLLAPFMLQSYTSYANIFLPEPGLIIPSYFMVGAVIITALVTIVTGIMTGFLGEEFGRIWRWNRK